MQLQVAVFSVRAYLSYLTLQGIEPQRLYDLVGLSREQLDQPDAMVDYRLSESLLAYGEQQLKCQNLGFKIGCGGDSSRWGVLGHIVDVCPTIAQALAMQKRYECLVGNVSRPEFVQGAQSSVLKWIPYSQCSTTMTEEALTSWITFAKKAISLDLAPLEVHFTHACVGEVQAYENYFKCPVYFNSSFIGIKFSNDILSLPLSGHNPELLKVLCGYADLLVSKKQKNAASEVINKYIMERLPEKVPTLQELANYLKVSPRTLQRKFRLQGTNFKAIVDDVRKENAYAYLLQTDYKLSYIAQVLGFSEQSVFQRAFKRWTGLTPGEYRAQHGVK